MGTASSRDSKLVAPAIVPDTAASQAPPNTRASDALTHAMRLTAARGIGVTSDPAIPGAGITGPAIPWGTMKLRNARAPKSDSDAAMCKPRRTTVAVSNRSMAYGPTVN